MNSMLRQHHVRLQDLKPFVRGYDPTKPQTAEEWAKIEGTLYEPGMMIFCLDAVSAPPGLTNFGKRDAESETYRVKDLCVVVGKEDGRSLVVNITASAYELRFLEVLMLEKARKAILDGKDFIFAVASPREAVNDTIKRELHNLGGMYAQGGSRRSLAVDGSGPQEPAMALISLLGVKLTAGLGKQVLDIGSICHMIYAPDGRQEDKNKSLVRSVFAGVTSAQLQGEEGAQPPEPYTPQPTYTAEQPYPPAGFAQEQPTFTPEGSYMQEPAFQPGFAEQQQPVAEQAAPETYAAPVEQPVYAVPEATFVPEQSYSQPEFAQPVSSAPAQMEVAAWYQLAHMVEIGNHGVAVAPPPVTPSIAAAAAAAAAVQSGSHPAVSAEQMYKSHAALVDEYAQKIVNQYSADVKPGDGQTPSSPPGVEQQYSFSEQPAPFTESQPVSDPFAQQYLQQPVAESAQPQPEQPQPDFTSQFMQDFDAGLAGPQAIEYAQKSMEQEREMFPPKEVTPDPYVQLAAAAALQGTEPQVPAAELGEIFETAGRGTLEYNSTGPESLSDTTDWSAAVQPQAQQAAEPQAEATPVAPSEVQSASGELFQQETSWLPPATEVPAQPVEPTPVVSQPELVEPPVVAAAEPAVQVETPQPEAIAQPEPVSYSEPAAQPEPVAQEEPVSATAEAAQVEQAPTTEPEFDASAQSEAGGTLFERLGQQLSKTPPASPSPRRSSSNLKALPEQVVNAETAPQIWTQESGGSLFEPTSTEEPAAAAQPSASAPQPVDVQTSSTESSPVVQSDMVAPAASTEVAATPEPSQPAASAEPPAPPVEPATLTPEPPQSISTSAQMSEPSRTESSSGLPVRRPRPRRGIEPSTPPIVQPAAAAETPAAEVPVDMAALTEPFSQPEGPPAQAIETSLPEPTEAQVPSQADPEQEGDYKHLAEALSGLLDSDSTAWSGTEKSAEPPTSAFVEEPTSFTAEPPKEEAAATAEPSGSEETKQDDAVTAAQELPPYTVLSTGYEPSAMQATSQDTTAPQAAEQPSALTPPPSVISSQDVAPISSQSGSDTQSAPPPPPLGRPHSFQPSAPAEPPAREPFANLSDSGVRRAPGADMGDSGVRRAPGSDLSDSAVRRAPGSDMTDSGVRRAPGSDLSDSAVRRAPGSDMTDSGVRRAPGSDMTDSGVRRAPGSDMTDSAVRRAPGSDMTDSAVRRAPGSDMTDSGVRRAPGSDMTDSGVRRAAEAADALKKKSVEFQEPKLVMNEMATLMSKLEQQVSKAAKRLGNRSDELRQRLNAHVEQMVEEASQIEKQSEVTASSLADRLNSQLDDVAEEVRTKVLETTSYASDSFKRTLGKSHSDIEDDRAHLFDSLSDLCKEFRNETESLTKKTEFKLQSLIGQKTRELKGMIDVICDAMDDGEHSYGAALQVRFDRFNERMTEEVNSMVTSLERNVRSMTEEIEAARDRAHEKLSASNSDFQQTVNHTVRTAELGLGQKTRTLLTSVILPREKEHRAILQTMSLEMRKQFIEDSSNQSRGQLQGLQSSLSAAREQLQELVEECMSSIDSVGKGQQSGLEDIFRGTSDRIERATNRAARVLQEGEKEINASEAICKRLAETSTVETEPELNEERNAAVSKLQQLKLQAGHELENTIERGCDRLERLSEDMNSELTAKRVEFSNGVRETAEQGLAKVREALHEAFQAIQAAREKYMD